jgi:anti-repressor protein
MGIDTGQNRFYKWLRENGYVIKRRGQDNNLPTQRSMDLGIMRIKESTIERGDTTMITKTTMITGKGQRYFIEKFRKMQEEKLNAS